MKNVRGKNIPIDTPQQKLEFYRNSNLDQSYVDLLKIIKEDQHPDKITSKSKLFKDIVIPWCKENNIESIMDIGCGWGKFIVWGNDALNLKVAHAMDLSDIKVKRLKNNLIENHIYNIKVGQGDIESTPCMHLDNSGDPKQFDLVMAIDLVEHFIDIEKGWNHLLQSGKHVYALIPKDRSFEWSEDHMHIVDDEMLDRLINLSNGLIWKHVIHFDDINSWYAIMVRGF